MKLFPTTSVFTVITIFIILNVIYAVAAANVSSATFLGEFAKNITIYSTYPVKLFCMITAIKPNGWLIELDFIGISFLVTYLISKILRPSNIIKKQI
jgi:hypothetical protein